MTYIIKKSEPKDSLYPKAFSNLKGMPSCLYYKGDISVLNQYNCVAIVGSRKCTDEGLIFARAAGRKAAELGLVVINGLALGCDTAAILGALDGNGKCVAIMPCGLNKIYPKSNEQLADRILEQGGCLISEYEPDEDPKKFTYVRRDRLQSAASQGVLVVEAFLESGTMNTVKATIKQNRRLAAYTAMSSFKNGNKYIIERGNVAISDMQQLNDFYLSLQKDAEYEQLSFL